VMKEAMRMFPVIGLPMMRIVPEGGATIAGRFFPKGVSLHSPSVLMILKACAS